MGGAGVAGGSAGESLSNERSKRGRVWLEVIGERI